MTPSLPAPKTAAPNAAEAFDWRLIQRGLMDVLARDHLHLLPTHVTGAVMARARARLRAFEALVKRLILYWALQLIPTLTIDMRPRNPAYTPAGRPAVRPISIPILPATPPPVPRDFSQIIPSDTPMQERSRAVDLRPLIQRFQRLHTLIENRSARAHRLAIALARRTRLLPPDRAAPPPRYLGTNLSACFTGLGHAIVQLDINRPPGTGPRPPPQPRCRYI